MEKNDFAANILGSATAGVIGRVVMHPVDTAKSRLQSPMYASYPGPIGAIVSIFKNEGFRGMYKGFGAVLFGGVPAICIYLSIYEVRPSAYALQLYMHCNGTIYISYR